MECEISDSPRFIICFLIEGGGHSDEKSWLVMIECDIDLVNDVVPVGKLFTTSLNSMSNLEGFGHEVDSVCVEEKAFVVPGVDFVEIKFNSDLVMGRE